MSTALDYKPIPPQRQAQRLDDIAYVAPMFVFLLGVWAGGHWPTLYPACYVLRAAAAAALLIVFRKRYTPISWNYAWLGALLGIVGIVQWVAMQLWLQNHFAYFRPATDAFNPFDHFQSPATRWSFIVVRIASASLVVPFMEELFWRDYLWRQIIAPNNFFLAKIGEWSWSPFLIVTAMFCTGHGNWWLTAIAWGLMIAGLLVRTKSLGACIVMHGTTNFLLGLYVLRFHDWAFW